MPSDRFIPATRPAVRLVISDVDGTLLTPARQVTSRSRQAVRDLAAAGIAFTITSSRPPLGLKMLIDALELEHPVAAFNGGVLVNPDLSLVPQYFLPPDVSQHVLDVLGHNALDAWLYTDEAWFVHSRHGPHVDREEGAVNFAPAVVSSYEALLDRAVKIVGVSDDHAAVARCEQAVRLDCGQRISATRSQAYYLDVTHPDANKGTVVRRFSSLLQVPEENIATIGDMPNDVLMFERSGISIAMGQAADDVKRAARFVTASNQEEGFALAMEKLILGRDTIDQGS